MSFLGRPSKEKARQIARQICLGSARFTITLDKDSITVHKRAS